MLAISIIFRLLFVVTSCSSESFPTVKSHSGEIRGHFKISNNEKNYKAYEGIPYAKPPIGIRRFMPPEPIEPWQEEVKADKLHAPCIGRHRIPDKDGEYVRGVEDCLYLNIYTPIKTANASLPVIFWIYGGVYDYSTLSGNEQYYLMDHDVIFVSHTHRHGTLGFLSTEDEVVTGNMGLKDQVLALKWISENIECFGGDPKKITIVGPSSGGASVHSHYLSKMSRGLFRSGISMSGTALHPWAQAKNSRNKAIRFGQLMNCSTDDMVRMVDCLRTKSAYSLLKAQSHFMSKDGAEFAPFGPVVEKKSKNPFIDRPPIDIINSGDLYDAPWITGIVSDEGLFPLAAFAENNTALQNFNQNWETLAPLMLQYYYTVPKEDHAAVARKIRNHYFGDKPINQENFHTLVKLFTHRIYFMNSEKAARAQAKVNRSPVRLYYYSHRASFSFADMVTNTTKNLGVCHGDFTASVFRIVDTFDVKKRPEDWAMHQNCMNFFVSVAQYGVPNFGPRWTAVNSSDINLHYLHMAGPDDFRDVTEDNFAEKNFWSTIDFNENKSRACDLISTSFLLLLSSLFCIHAF